MRIRAGTVHVTYPNENVEPAESFPYASVTTATHISAKKEKHVLLLAEII